MDSSSFCYLVKCVVFYCKYYVKTEALILYKHSEIIIIEMTISLESYYERFKKRTNLHKKAYIFTSVQTAPWGVDFDQCTFYKISIQYHHSQVTTSTSKVWEKRRLTKIGNHVYACENVQNYGRP